MSGGTTVLRLPGDASISCDQDYAECSDGPTMQRIAGSKRDSEKMISYSSGALNPSATAVSGRKNHAARTTDNDARFVFNIETVERAISGSLLLLPLKASIGRAQHDTIATGSPTMPFVGGEANAVYGITLW